MLWGTPVVVPNRVGGRNPNWPETIFQGIWRRFYSKSTAPGNWVGERGNIEPCGYVGQRCRGRNSTNTQRGHYPAVSTSKKALFRPSSSRRHDGDHVIRLQFQPEWKSFHDRPRNKSREWLKDNMASVKPHMDAMRKLGLINKQQMREFVKKGRPIKTNGYRLVQPDFARFNGRLDSIPASMRQGLDEGKALYIKHAYPVNTFGEMTYVLKKKDGELQLTHSKFGTTKSGQAAIQQKLDENIDWEVDDDLTGTMPKRYRQHWIVEEDLQAARLDGQVVEVRHTVVPIAGRGIRSLGGVAYVNKGKPQARPIPIEDAIKQLYMQLEYGGHGEKYARQLAAEWKAANQKIVEYLSKRLHQNTSRTHGIPFASSAFKSTLIVHDPMYKKTLSVGWAVDTMPIFNGKKGRFDVGLNEVQVEPGLNGLFEVHPEKREQLYDWFRKMEPERLSRLAKRRPKLNMDYKGSSKERQDEKKGGV